MSSASFAFPFPPSQAPIAARFSQTARRAGEYAPADPGDLFAAGSRSDSFNLGATVANCDRYPNVDSFASEPRATSTAAVQKSLMKQSNCSLVVIIAIERKACKAYRNHYLRDTTHSTTR